jgi:hypothetical protein
MHSSETDPHRDPELELELEPGEDGQDLEPAGETGSDDRLDEQVREKIVEAAAGDDGG